MITTAIITVTISQLVAIYYSKNQFKQLWNRSKVIFIGSFMLSMAMLLAMFYFEWYLLITIMSIMSITVYSYSILRHER